MSDALDQFVEDYVTSRHTKIKKQGEEVKAWEQARKLQQFQVMAPKITQGVQDVFGSLGMGQSPKVVGGGSRIPDMFQGDPTAVPKPDSTGSFLGADSSFALDSVGVQQQRITSSGQFAREMENAYYSAPNGDPPPMEYFLKYNLDDLKMFADPSLGIDYDWLQTRQESMASHQRFLASIEDETSRRYEQALRGNTFFKNLGTGFDSLVLGKKKAYENLRAQQEAGTGVDRTKIRENVFLEFTGQRDKLYAEQISIGREAFVSQLRTQLTHRVASSSTPQGMLESLVSKTAPKGPKNKLSTEKTGETVERYIQSKADEWEANVKKELLGNGDPAKILNSDGIFASLFKSGTGAFGAGVSMVAEGVGGLLWLADEVIPGSDVGPSIFGYKPLSPNAYFVNRHQAKTDELVAEYKSQMNESDTKLMQNAATTSTEVAWDELKTNKPDEYKKLLAMASGNEIMAQGFFSAAIQDTPEVQAQLQDWVKNVRANEDLMITDLRERDFRFSNEVLDILSMWGRNGPMRIATSATILLTQQDYWDEVTNGQFVKLWNEVGKATERAGFSPSGALGIDGSLLGLVLDLTGGIVADPFTYLLGPRFAGAKGGAAVAEDALRFTESAVGRQVLNDMVDFARSPSRSTGSFYHIAEFLGAKYWGELLDETGLQTKILPRRDWALHRSGQSAMEVKVSALRRLVSDDALKALWKTDDLSVFQKHFTTLGENIKRNGFAEPGTITVSRADNTIHMSDGVKRLVASEKAGISHMPITLRVVDDAAAGNTVIKGFSEAESARIAALANKDLSFQTKLQAGRVAGANEDTASSVMGIASSVGETRGLGADVGTVTLKDGTTLGVKVIAEGFADNVVLYYVVDDSGKVMAAVSGKTGNVIDAPGGISIGVKEGSRKQGIMSELFDFAAKKGDNFVLQAGLSGSLSDDGLAFIQSYAKKLLETAQGNLATKGIPLSDFLGDSSQVTSLKKLGSGEVSVRPDRLLPRDVLLGPVSSERIASIMRRAVENGASPSRMRSAMTATTRGRIRNAIKTNMPQEIRRFMTQANTVTRLRLVGPGAMDTIVDQVVRIWGNNLGKVDEWMSQFMEYQRSASRVVGDNQAKLSVLVPQLKSIQAMEDLAGGAWDSAIRTASLKEGAEQGVQAIKANRLQLRKALADERASFEVKALEIHKSLETPVDTTQLEKLIKGMWDDFNRTEIAPKWKGDVNPETGMVPWEKLAKGRGRRQATTPDNFSEKDWLSEDLAYVAEQAGIENPQRLASFLNSHLKLPVSVETPLSPLELIGAATVSGKAYIRFTQTVTGNAVREAAHAFTKLWVMDKVFSVATAMTVSGDELVRIMHEGGAPAVKRWLGDRALFLEGRVQYALRGQDIGSNGIVTRALGRDSVEKSSALNPRVQARLEDLAEFSLRSRQFERIFYDDAGLGWTDIFPEDAGFRDAAQQYFGGLFANTGFRAFLKSKKAFTEWFFGNDGGLYRNATVIERGTNGAPRSTMLSSVDDAYNGWKNILEKVLLNKAKQNGKFAEVMAAFKETAARMDDVGGKPINLPGWVYDHMDAVRGTQRHAPARYNVVSRAASAFFDRAFLDPVNYRRGFLAQIVAKSERSRLEALFATQNKRIMTDLEIAQALELKGFGNINSTGARAFIQEQALARGIIPESYVDDLVQKVVDTELDHVLYQAERGSRAGGSITGVFPFAKPWADMAGYWGREMIRRPYYRGQMNEANAFNLQSLVTARDMINPRPFSLISRLAATNFTIDRGWTGTTGGQAQGLFPGSERTDVSPLLFLPTGGKNAFGTILPGFGFVPMFMLDLVLTKAIDPVKEPEKYQSWLDSLGDFVPGANYGNPDVALSAIQRIAGGGATSKAVSMALDMFSYFRGGSFKPVSTMFGSISREVNRTRMASVVMADPKVWEDLQSLTDANAIDLFLSSLSLEADKKAAASDMSKIITRFALPTNNTFSGDLDTLWGVWLDAGAKYSELAGSGTFDAEAATPEERKKFAGDVRKAFFRLPQWQRDRMVAETPQLAVNLVSTWAWSDKAFTDNLPGTEVAYRSDGSKSGLARHEIYLKVGYIRPLEPVERMRRIIGLYYASRRNAAKQIYEFTAQSVNTALWDGVVGGDTKVLLQRLLDEAPWLAQQFDIRSPKELWEAWGSREGDFEKFIADAAKIAQENGKDTDFAKLKKFINVPSKEKAWGTSFPGVDPSQLSGRFKNVTFASGDFSSETRSLANVFGIDLSNGMNGLQLYNAVQKAVVATQNPLSFFVAPSYNAYIGSRGAARTAADQYMRSVGYNPAFDSKWGSKVIQFLTFADNIDSRYRETPLGIPGPEQVKVQQRFMELRTSAAGSTNVDWNQIWKVAYKRTFGPLEWTPPEPAPWQVDGEVSNDAYQPFIKKVIDGDSLVVRNRAGAQTYHEVRLLGVRARDFGIDDSGAITDRTRLTDALQTALANNDRIYLVRQPDPFGVVDPYGRELAWLWIGDSPFYFPDELLPNRDPSGGAS